MQPPEIHPSIYFSGRAPDYNQNQSPLLVFSSAELPRFRSREVLLDILRCRRRPPDVTETRRGPRNLDLGEVRSGLDDARFCVGLG